MIPQKTIEELIIKHSNLEKDLSSGKIDKNIFAEKSKEYSDLNEIIGDAQKYISFENDKIELEKILNDGETDSELLKMAETELNELKSQYNLSEKRLKLFLLPKMRQIKKMRLLKLELVQAVLRQVYLLLIFSKCMKK